MLVIF